MCCTGIIRCKKEHQQCQFQSISTKTFTCIIFDMHNIVGLIFNVFIYFYLSTKVSQKVSQMETAYVFVYPNMNRGD